MAVEQQYGRVVTAALAETRSKFELAEALALDIPPRPQGGSVDNDQSVREYLAEAREVIIVAGGEPRAVETLREYRKTALWVESGRDFPPTFAWVQGVSFSAHDEARKTGLSYEDFAAMPKKTVREARQLTGSRPPDGEAATRQAVRSLPPDRKAEIVREALAESEVADQVVRHTPTRANLARAENTVDRQQQERARQDYDLHEPRSVQIGAHADMQYALTKARTAMSDALEAADILAAHGWPDNSHTNAEVLARRVSAGVELFMARVRGEDLDRELQALLEGGER